MRESRRKLYALSYEFRKTKIWEKFLITDCYVLKTKEYGDLFIQILGNGSSFIGLNVFTCKEDLQRIMTAEVNSKKDAILCTRSLQMIFSEKSTFLNEEYEEARNYVKEVGLNAKKYPQFLKAVPYYEPWCTNEEDEEILAAAVESAILFSKRLRYADITKIGITSLMNLPKEITAFSVENGEICNAGTVSVDLYTEFEEEYPRPLLKNTDAFHDLKQAGVFECEMVRSHTMVEDEEGKHAPYLPIDMIFVEKSSKDVLPVVEGFYYETEADAYLDEFVKAMLAMKWYPKTIRCKDQRTYCFLEDFANQLNIKLSIYKGKLEALEFAKSCLADENIHGDHMDEREIISKVITKILSMSDEEVKQLPEKFINQMQMLLSTNILNPATEKKLRKKLHL